ncbi:polysaccharide lyase family 8 protein [Flammula alnicola]|nr:polysaccharide lyase family 8 protein [Flammula alnicola]
MKQTTVALLLLSVLYAQTSLVASDDVTVARQQRLSVIVGSTTGATSISAWLSTLGSDGKWPDSEINYTTGCDAQAASWPAQSHWSRINTFAAAWHGGLKNAAQFAGNATLRASTSSAMNFWFSNDFTVPACLDSGGTAACPCSTPGLWNTNWDSNVILIPGWVGQVCLLLGDSLTTSESLGCQRMTSRSYGTFLTGINGVSSITGANTMDIASIGIDLGLSTANTTLLTDAYNRVHQELTVKNGLKVDGIRADGSFGQHAGILYNGNYGKDYANDVYNLELTAAGTAFQAPTTSRSAFISLLQANQWMIFKNVVTDVLHWDFSVLGRIISLPVADDQATENLKTNLTQMQALGQLWNSPEITQVFDDLSVNSTTANIGSLNGNNMFYANDYMVQRGNGYVTTLKMFSNRTQNTECLNSQNPFGFHLSDGAVYNYVTGNEYEDIFPAWDWNLIPGTTVDYGATPLSCSTAQKTGTQSFVGGASDGTIGVAAMRYETPTTKTLNWRKTWFFLNNDVQFVMVARLTSSTTAPVFSVLDQRRQDGPVFVNGIQSTGGNFSSAATLWHGGVGYAFNTSNPSTSLSLSLSTSTGSWQTISTSSQLPVTVDLFSAWLNHIDTTASISYTVFPGTTQASFQQKLTALQLNSIRNDGSISALLDASNNIAMLVYWVAGGGSVTVPSTTGKAALTVKTNGNSIIIMNLSTWAITVSDPTQSLTSVTMTFSLGSGSIPAGWASSSRSLNLTITLPAGGIIGSTVQQSLF